MLTSIFTLDTFADRIVLSNASKYEICCRLVLHCKACKDSKYPPKSQCKYPMPSSDWERTLEDAQSLDKIQSEEQNTCLCFQVYSIRGML